jgi:lysophospholipase L1-like esterase
MKPLQTLAFIVAVLILLSGVAAIFPENGIKIGNDLIIKFPSLKQFFFPEKIEYADINDLVTKVEAGIDSTAAKDSLSYVTDTVNVDSLVNVVQKIEFPDNDPAALDHFFSNLQSNSGLIRVLHYGDSQIEGDRITGFLRNRFQSRFGGSGGGLLSPIEVNNISGAVAIESEGEWKRYTLFGKVNKDVPHKRYGVMLSFCRFASLTLKKSPAAYGGAFNFTKVKILYGNNKKPVVAELYNGEQLLGFETLLSADGLQIAQWTIQTPPQELKIKLVGKDSPDIYAIAVDNDRGVAFDNIPLRGSSGTDFARSDLAFLGQIYDKLNVRMLILQFGVNVVPNVQEDYTFYENWIYSQLMALKRIRPDMSILVIGISDMAKKVDDHYESYPNIEKIRDAQKRAAFRAKCAFWDLYLAMGGKNSMPSWAMADPPLAAKDFTHLSPKGARIVAEMLYNALVYEYNQFKDRKKSGV